MRAVLACALAGLCIAVTACSGDDNDPTAEVATATSTTARSPDGQTAPPRTAATPTSTGAPAVDLCPYRGLGTWVDVYDTLPAFAERGRVSPVTPGDVATMAEHGVHTLYLQAAKDDPRTPGILASPEQAAAFLTAAHDAGIRVVAWYLPSHLDEQLDLDRAKALVEFEADGERFDGVALDIENTEAVTDVAERNARLVRLVRALDDSAGSMPIGAIVYPPVALDVLNTTLWPDFPYREIAPYVDVWLPMAYWTFRDDASGYRDAGRYTQENVERLREHIGDPDTAVHPIGGIADEVTSVDIEDFLRAANETGAIGVSLYDFDTLDPSAWSALATPSRC
jgi:hypothetical protein